MEALAAQHVGPPPEGWAAFFTTHGEALIRAAAAILGPNAARGTGAEDVVSKVLTKLIKRGIRVDANPRAYVLAAVKNAAYDERRPLKRHTDEEIVFDELVGTHSIEDDVDDRLLAEQLLMAIADLPDREAHAIREKFLRQRPWREVAAEVGVTTSQGLGKLVNGGLEKLRRMPRFASLSRNVSRSPGPLPTTTGEKRGTTP